MTQAPQPLFFGPEGRPLFGCLHRPPPGAARRSIGIVLCNPSGYEAICTHRTYRHFAAQAASLGFPALRFDYDGTGDSSGRTLDPGRVPAWLHSIGLAIDTLKQLAQVEHVCLFGVRIAASLACVAAQERSDVAALIAFAPVVKVKAYLREIRALELARPRIEPPEGLSLDPTLQEAAGFATSEETRAELSKIDLLQLGRTPARHVLVMHRDDMPPDDAWPRHLATQGAHVEHLKLDRYVDMMRDAHASVVPTAAIETALAWLTSLPGVATATTSKVPAPSPTASALIFDTRKPGSRVRETAAFFGTGHQLFGVVTEPVEPSPDGRALILLNSGAIHHIGPGRLYVAIARLCASLGFSVLRMDLSGVGETPARTGEQENRPYSPCAQADVEEAVRFMSATRGSIDIHLVGLCSGAYHGLKAAVRGLPLRGVVIINPLTFFWKEGMSLDYADFQVTSEANRYRRSAMQLSSWLKLLRGRVNIANVAAIFRRRFAAAANNAAREVARVLRIPLREDLASELQLIAKQNIDLFFVFSSTDPGLAMLREQGGRSLRQLSRRSALRIAVIHGADHTFTAQWNRDELTEVLLSHLDRAPAQ